MATVLAAGAVVGAIAAVAALGTRRVVVRGVSMCPLLDEGERVLVDRLAYWRWLPQRGDVVLLRGPRGDGPGMLLKRVVGLPGETVTLARDRLHVDGVLLDLGRPVVGSSPGTWMLGPDELFVLSDNLAVGTDSRHTGPVRRADLLGRAWLVYAPSVRRLAGRALDVPITPTLLDQAKARSATRLQRGAAAGRATWTAPCKPCAPVNPNV